MAVAAGTPTMLATVRPRNIRETPERALRSGATMPVATTAPTPKKAPCGRPLTKRAASREISPGATANRALPTTKSAIRAIRTARRDIRVVAAASSGAPMTTPSA
ncbi:hypothetical protein STENM223S_01260 [Streptomyces tendae]